MRQAVPCFHREHRVSLRGSGLPEVVCPAWHKGQQLQTHYVFPTAQASAFSLRLDLRDAERTCQPDFAAARKELALGPDAFPYDMTERDWWDYCVAPHSYLALNTRHCQVGLNFFNRFLHLDLHRRSAAWVDPGVDNEMLSTQNCVDPQTGEIWFASWPVADTVRRMRQPQHPVRVTIWRQALQDRRPQQVWQGAFADSLHQLALSPDRRFLILTELGLRCTASATGELPRPVAPGRKRKGQLIPSEILVLDLKTGRPWRLPMLTASHVAFDPAEPGHCYLSGHNIGLIGDNVGIFGPGVMQKFALTETGPQLLGTFTAPGFHRVTTHLVFRHRGQTLLAVSGYPDTVYLIAAATMKLFKTLKLAPGEKVDTARAPHICRQDSYGLGVSADGERLLVAGTRSLQLAHIADGRFSFQKRITGYNRKACFTGHLGQSALVSPHLAS